MPFQSRGGLLQTSFHLKFNARKLPTKDYNGAVEVLMRATGARRLAHVGHIDRRIEPPGNTPDRGGQGRSGPQKAQFSDMFWGAGSSRPDMSTAVARALEVKSAGLGKDTRREFRYPFQPFTRPRLMEVGEGRHDPMGRASFGAGGAAL